MIRGPDYKWMDPLYGEVSVSASIGKLSRIPAVQRLRHVRLSNIDSVDSPGIAGISRYEHVLGVAYLASQIGLLPSLNNEERTCLMAAAMLHDLAITPFGHLVEEAFSYVTAPFDHEDKWLVISENPSEEIGGLDLQIFNGREAGLKRWASEVFGARCDHALTRIFGIVKGEGDLGRCLVSDVDIDNLDNVVRAAHHIGLGPDKKLPLRVARAMVAGAASGTFTFSESAMPDLEEWLRLRSEVYTHFMLSNQDFAGKIMLLSATIKALNSQVLTLHDWKLTDHEYISRLKTSQTPGLVDPVVRWQLGDVWTLSPLWWCQGVRPEYKELGRLGEVLSDGLRRECLAYGIKDKRTRNIRVTLSNGEERTIGRNPDSWLLGVGSPVRRPFDSTAKSYIRRLTGEVLRTTVLGVAGRAESPSLF